MNGLLAQVNAERVADIVEDAAATAADDGAWNGSR